jgi:hypothetical protein
MRYHAGADSARKAGRELVWSLDSDEKRAKIKKKPPKAPVIGEEAGE